MIFENIIALRRCFNLRLLFAMTTVVMLSVNAYAQDSKPAAEDSAPAAESSVEPKSDSPDAEAAKATPQGEEEKPKKPLPPPPETQQPYHVQIHLSFSSSSALSGNTRERVRQDVQNQLKAQFWEMWVLDTQIASQNLFVSSQQMKSLQDDVMKEPLTALKQDKIFLVAVDFISGKYTVSTREWDQCSETLGSEHAHATFERRHLCDKITESISDAFRPLAELEVIDGDTVEYLIRAGELYPRDPGMAQFQVGDFLVPFMRYMNRKREVQKIQLVPWTYLRVEEITRSRIRLSMTSAFPAPIPNSRRRVSVMGMRIRPHLSATEIKIYPRGNERNPLVGVRCDIMNRPKTDDDPVDDRINLATDRRGIVTVPVIAKEPLQYILVLSGDARLAWVPFIPGNRPYLEVEVPDDAARLHVEGEVALLQSELIDIIATREVLMARCRATAKKKGWDDVDGFLAELKELQTFEQFQARIETLRVQAVFAARQANDRVAEKRVKRLCGTVEESAEKHLDPRRLENFRREITQLRAE